MALIFTVPCETGTEFPDQYCRIDEVRAEKNRMIYTIGVYFNKDMSNGLPPHRTETREAPFDLYSTDNLWQQAYADLKTRWPNAVDA